MQEKTKAKCEAPTPIITTLYLYSFHTINRYRERVERQFKIVKPDATAAELKDVVDGDFQDIFAKHLMTNQHKAAQQAIADINDKHQVCALPPFCNCFQSAHYDTGYCEVRAQHHRAASGECVCQSRA
jgi:hypothetical protein